MRTIEPKAQWHLNASILATLEYRLGPKAYLELRSHSTYRFRKATSEEILRQLFAALLIHEANYPPERLRFEHPVQMGRSNKRADIVVLNEFGAPMAVVEVKCLEGAKDLEQLKSYVAALGVTYGALVSAKSFIGQVRTPDGHFHTVQTFPSREPTPKQVAKPTVLDKKAEADAKNKAEADAKNKAEADAKNKAEADAKNKAEADANKKAAAEIKLLDSIEMSITGFLRKSATRSELIIDGHHLDIANKDFDQYRKIRSHALSVGRVWPEKVPSTRWRDFIAGLFNSVPAPAAQPTIDEPVIDFVSHSAEQIIEHSFEKNGWIAANTLYKAYEAWAGPNALSIHKFGRIMGQHYKKKRTTAGNYYFLRPE